MVGEATLTGPEPAASKGPLPVLAEDEPASRVQYHGHKFGCVYPTVGIQHHTLKRIHDILLHRSKHENIQWLQGRRHRRCQEHEDDLVPSCGVGDPRVRVARRAVQEQYQLGERLQRPQPLPQILQDPNHEIHTIP